jgi:DNA mismatch endonuclease (patch repair protein)
MPDVFTKRKRSAVMSRIRSRGNMKTELTLAKLFRAAGITGWRRQAKLRLPSTTWRAGPARPTHHGGQANVSVDFVFAKKRVAVFVDGCFWHGCRWHGTQPRQNAAFWRHKLDANKRRDRLVNRTLRRQGWTVIRIWEHELAIRMKAVERIREALRRL